MHVTHGEIFAWYEMSKFTPYGIIFYFIPDTQQKKISDSGTESDENLGKKGRGAQAAGIISIVFLIGVLTALICWLWRRRSSRLVAYRGNETLHLHDQIIRNHFRLPKYLLLSNRKRESMTKLPAHGSRKSWHYQKPGESWGGNVVPQDILLHSFLFLCLSLTGINFWM